MAAAFFQGTLGQFTAYSALGQLDRATTSPSAGRPYQPAEPESSNQTPGNNEVGYSNMNKSIDGNSPTAQVGSRGIAQTKSQG